MRTQYKINDASGKLPSFNSYIRHTFLLLFLVALVSCGSAVSIVPVSDSIYPPTNSISIITETPGRPFEILAKFIAPAKDVCQDGGQQCALLYRARKIGADAAWIQKKETIEHSGDWVEYRGRLVRIYPWTQIRMSGVLIRYR